MQVLAYTFGGKVERRAQREDGQFVIHVDTNSLLFDSLAADQSVLLTHGDSVVSLVCSHILIRLLNSQDDGWKIIATSGDLISGIALPDKHLYGVQFHPEVDLSVNGKQMLANFLFKVASFTGMVDLIFTIIIQQATSRWKIDIKRR